MDVAKRNGPSTQGCPVGGFYSQSGLWGTRGNVIRSFYTYLYATQQRNLVVQAQTRLHRRDDREAYFCNVIEARLVVAHCAITNHSEIKM